MDPLALTDQKGSRKKWLLRGGAALAVVLTAGGAYWRFGRSHEVASVDAHADAHEASTESAHEASTESAHEASTESAHDGATEEETGVASADEEGDDAPTAVESKVAHHEPEPSIFIQVGKAYVEMGRRIQEKVERIQALEEENIRLRAESVRLRHQLASLEFAQDKRKAQEHVAEVQRKLAAQTGSKAGQTFDQITYRPPTSLSNSQLLTLGVSYFKAREDEKAAVIFQQLVESDDQTFRSHRVLTLAGAAWYRLKNYKLAESYFDRVLSNEDPQPELLRYRAQARMWKGLIARSLGKGAEAQRWFKEVIDHHPQSQEAKWINHRNTEVKRDTASEHSTPHH